MEIAEMKIGDYRGIIDHPDRNDYKLRSFLEEMKKKNGCAKVAFAKKRISSNDGIGSYEATFIVMAYHANSRISTIEQGALVEGTLSPRYSAWSNRHSFSSKDTLNQYLTEEGFMDFSETISLKGLLKKKANTNPRDNRDSQVEEEIEKKSRVPKISKKSIQGLVGIEKALKEGCKLHAFRSGGGLRVVTIDKDEETKGYGEHPHVEDALSHANEDFLAGGRPYNEVYGENGLKPGYLTGSSTPTNSLDSWLLQGHIFDAWQDGDNITFQFKGLIIGKTPKAICDEVLRSGEPVTWENRGYTYRSTKFRFPNGEYGVSSEVIKSPKDKKPNSDPWMYYITKTGHGKDLWTAMGKAFEAEEVEVEG